MWAACLAGAILASAASGSAGRSAKALAVVMAPFALWALLIHGLFSTDAPTVLAEAGPARITAEGLARAGSLILRTAAMVGVMLAFTLWVDVRVLRAALARRGVPAPVGYVLASALALSSHARQRLARIRAAQEARGLLVRPGLAGRLAAARHQALPLVLALVDEAGERACALEARGQRLPGPRTSYVTEPDSAWQRLARWTAAAAAAAVTLAAVVPTVAGGAAGLVR